MDVEILTIGSELTSGAVVNTNAAELSRRLASVGLPCRRQVTVGDARTDLLDAVREALGRCQVLITTGGLGPTFDDVTMDALAEATGRPLTRAPSVAAAIRRFYTRRHRRLQQAALRQADLPQGAKPLPNPIGTAPGMWLQLPQRTLIALPGVPAEMRAILDSSVMPRLRRLAGARCLESRTLRTIGLVELAIQQRLQRVRIPPTVEVGLYPHLRMVDVRLTATGASRAAACRALDRLEAALRRHLGQAVYGTGGETLEAVIGRLLVRRRKTLAVAESCTGGLVTDRLTNVPGSSRYLRGSLVAYHNDLKRGGLGVPQRILAAHGAVSAPTVNAMAAGIRRLAGASIGLAITGIAGPTGATAAKPVGLVYLGIADGRRLIAQRHQLFGDRLSIKSQAAQAALDLLRRTLL